MKKISLLLLLGALSLTSTPAAAQKTFLFGDPDTYIIALRDSYDENTFNVYDGKLLISGKPMGYIRTTRKYTNFILSLQWRWVDHASDGGIYMFLDDNNVVWPKGLQMQMAPDGLGSLMGTVAMEGVAPEKNFYRKPIISSSTHEKAVGKWNKTEIRCKDGHITVHITVHKVNEAVTPARSGYIGFQSEGGPMEMRNIIVRPYYTD